MLRFLTINNIQKNKTPNKKPDPIKILSVNDLIKIAKNKKTINIFFLKPIIIILKILIIINTNEIPNRE